MFKKISIVLAVVLLQSCMESTPTRVVIVDKSFNDKKFIELSRHIIADTKSQNITSKNTTKITKKVTPIKHKSNKKIVASTTPWISPIDAPIFKTFAKNNQGITFDSKNNQSIRAIADGMVVYSSNSLKSYGVMVIIKHKYGFYSHYMFTQKSMVSVGDKVKQGENIAITGASKFYLSMKKFTTAVNPATYIKF
jgi:lipoprotein NlpD